MLVNSVRLFFILLLFSLSLGAQNNVTDKVDLGSFSGDFTLNGKVYVTDTAINATGTPFFDYLKNSADSWFSLNYNKSTLGIGVRFDMFNNSDIFSGGITEANGIGIGSWYVRKSIEKLEMQAGYIYDQFGSGTTFRAYENRGLALDNPLVGMKAKYHITKNIFINGIAGKQKHFRAFVDEDRRFINVYSPFIKGANLEGNFSIKDKLYLIPGASIVNRTIDKESMNSIAEEINKQNIDDRFYPKYNTFAYSIYNTLSFGDFSLYMEYAGKTEDVLRNESKLYAATGQVLFGSFSWSKKGIGINLQAKKTTDFDFRTSPLETLNNGFVHFLPPQTRQNSLRLLSRYNHNTQLLEEFGYQVDITAKPNKLLTFTANFSNVENNTELLFREIYVDCLIKKRKAKWKLLTGVQMVDYNQRVYELKPDADMVQTLTPFAEFTYKLDRKKSIRAELQYMLTKRDYRVFGGDDPKPNKEQDLGDWLYGLVEFNIAPRFSLSVSDLYNVPAKQHYYDISTSYTNKTNRYAIGYVKQVQGIICTGGVCRFENAFSGVKASISSNF